MATRSLIILDNGRGVDGRYEYVYCHWDGYPEGVGKTLLEHYNTLDDIETLLSNGHISSLREHVSNDTEFDHTFEKPLAGVTVFYGRDRGEKDTESRSSDTIPLNSEFGTDYKYIFSDGIWYVSYYTVEGEVLEWKLLEEVLDSDYEGDAPLGEWSSVVSDEKKKLAVLLSKESKENMKDSLRYIIEHYLTDRDAMGIIGELFGWEA